MILDDFMYKKIDELCGEFGELVAEQAVLYYGDDDAASVPMAMFMLDNYLRSAYHNWLIHMQGRELDTEP